MKIYLSALLFIYAAAYAAYFANPALPALQREGILISSGQVSLRAGYLNDYLYQQRFDEEFPSSMFQNPSNLATLATQAGTLTLNLKQTLDLTGIAGGSVLQIDNEVYGSMRFAWGVGAKLLLYRTGSFFCGLDVKYFETDQKPRYLVSDGYAYTVRSPFRFHYSELQCAIGAAYRTKWLSPYAHLTYLYAKIDPTPHFVSVQIPFYDALADAPARSIVGQRRWGMALGGTIVGGRKGSITIESRLFNQNAISASGELRF